MAVLHVPTGGPTLNGRSGVARGCRALAASHVRFREVVAAFPRSCARPLPMWRKTAPRRNSRKTPTGAGATQIAHAPKKNPCLVPVVLDRRCFVLRNSTAVTNGGGPVQRRAGEFARGFSLWCRLTLLALTLLLLRCCLGLARHLTASVWKGWPPLHTMVRGVFEGAAHHAH